ncbi:MAG: BspA family leucine-rich repeat surface protein [Defluviitaleaceae bacterium]|nr:BspA family leucine-rich repeat surface protein [Defluviitaleaceae bacterium]MCL2263272.1 BspA family leucine-rich repeat surface protein [Defluviitaleaceae bacterium]
MYKKCKTVLCFMMAVIISVWGMPVTAEMYRYYEDDTLDVDAMFANSVFPQNWDELQEAVQSVQQGVPVNIVLITTISPPNTWQTLNINGVVMFSGSGEFGGNVDNSGSLIISGGSIGNVDNSGYLLINGGSVGEVANWHSVTMTGGTVRRINNDGRFAMQGGTISDEHWGGGTGVENQNNATFTMDGGTIMRHGIGVRNNGTFIMNGGSILNNMTHGIWTNRHGFSVGSAATVSGTANPGDGNWWSISLTRLVEDFLRLQGIPSAIMPFVANGNIYIEGLWRDFYHLEGQFPDGIGIPGAVWRYIRYNRITVYGGFVSLPLPWDWHSANTITFTEPVTIDNAYAMFAALHSLTTIQGLHHFNTRNVTNMNRMFAAPVTHLDLSSFSTGNVTDMGDMFAGSNVSTLNLSSFNTRNVINMSGMFRGIGVARLDLSNFDTRNVTNMNSMFRYATDLISVDLSSFDTSRVTNMSNMFNGTESLTRLDLSNFDTRNVTNMDYMFGLPNELHLRQLTLGENFRFPEDSTALPAIPVTAQFNGRWQNVGGGTVANPSGQFSFTSAELMAFYETQGFADTWVWQRASAVVNAAPVITYANAPNGRVGTDYGFNGNGFQFNASGTPTPEWAYSGALPPGLNLSAQGLLYGTPTQDGSFTFTVTAINGVNPASSQEITIEISPQPSPTDTVLTVSSGFANPSEDVQVQIGIKNNPGFASMLMKISFPDEFTLTGYTLADHSLYEKFHTPDDLSEVGNYVFMGWAGRTSNITLDGELLTLTFSVSENASVNNPITIIFENPYDGHDTPANANDEELSIAITNGTIRVVPARLGDFNGDGRVTSADATILARHIVGHDVTIDRRAAHSFPAETIPTTELIRLARTLVGHFTTLCPVYPAHCGRCNP